MAEIDEFISPEGQLTPDLFPGRELALLVSAWLTDANVRSAAADTVDQQEQAVLAWVYYRAYFDVWQRLSSNPASLSLDGTSMSMGQDQINAYFNLWRSYKADYDAALGLKRGSATASKSAKATATW